MNDDGVWRHLALWAIGILSSIATALGGFGLRKAVEVDRAQSVSDSRMKSAESRLKICDDHKEKVAERLGSIEREQARATEQIAAIRETLAGLPRNIASELRDLFHEGPR